MTNKNKRRGYLAEKWIEKKLSSWGLECKRTPLSGAIKTKFEINGNLLTLSGDLTVIINGEQYKIEVKSRQTQNDRHYKLVEQTEFSAYEIEDFCLIMREKYFFDLINGKPGKTSLIPNKRFADLHKYFFQDNADIIALRGHNRRTAVFAITLNLWHKLKNNGGI